MEYKHLVVIGLAILSLSSCMGKLQHTNYSIPPQKITDTTLLVNPVFCPPQNERANLFFNYGVQMADQSELEYAIRSYRKAIELDPNFCDAMDNLGQIFRRQNKLDDAIYWYKRSIEVFPNNSVAHTNLAVVYHIQENWNESISEYQIVINIDPDDPEGYYGLGDIYLDMNEPLLAIENLKTAEQLYARRSSPLISDARYQLGVTYFNLKDYKIAMDYMKQIYSEKRDSPVVNYIIGLCYLDANDSNEAKKYLKRAQELGMRIPPDLAQKLNL